MIGDLIQTLEGKMFKKLHAILHLLGSNLLILGHPYKTLYKHTMISAISFAVMKYYKSAFS